jgi:TolB-like protein/Tfp pilus assembly protein PilF
MPLARRDYLALAAILLFGGFVLAALVGQLWTGPGTPAAASARAIAVLPFENLSGEAQNASLTDGVHDDILSRLSRIGSLEVISRTSVMRYRDTLLSIPEITRELGVGSVLEGGVQRDGERVRISVRLIDAEKDRQVWSETYDRALSAAGLFDIQSEIAETIAGKLAATLTSRDEARLQQRPTDSLAAYESYLLGRDRIDRRTSASLREAETFFQRAIELDEDYAAAYVGLAETYFLLSAYGDLGGEEARTLAWPLVERALELDPYSADAHVARGNLLVDSIADIADAYRRAIELDPNNAVAHLRLANLYLFTGGDVGETIALLERAVRLDPLSPTIQLTLGEAFELAGRFDDARAQYEKSLEIDPGFPSGYLLIGGLYAGVEGRLDEALRWQLRATEEDPGNLRNLATVANTWLDLGDPAAASDWLDRALAAGEDGFWPVWVRSRQEAWAGDREALRASAMELHGIQPRNNFSLFILVVLGEDEAAIDLHAAHYPELGCDRDPWVNHSNLGAALNLSLAHERRGRADCARRLLEASRALIATLPERGLRGRVHAEAEVHARLGEPEQALTALRAAVDRGWRVGWWYLLDRNPHFASIHDRPEFRELQAEIEEDVGRQLDRVRRLAGEGRLTAVGLSGPASRMPAER